MTEDVDNALAKRFEQEVWSKVPHLEEGSETTVANATPRVDVTRYVKDSATSV